MPIKEILLKVFLLHPDISRGDKIRGVLWSAAFVGFLIALLWA